MLEKSEAQSQCSKIQSSTYFWLENPENLKQLATIMAIGSTSASKQSLQNHQKGKMSNSGKKKEDRSRKRSNDDGVNLRAKRTKRAGVRLVGGRIYDSVLNCSWYLYLWDSRVLQSIE
ncbi:hypothetical protein RHMOL_Rhmol08G0285900 [Rhododendron molle]|uniref:Uncharacterized protein n=1 Tax=Rhododendron molle TaxID=49168 RepID=A0ACC0MVH0_RHOML|nr:hypothetical protein RHMOL_Rhmol08G0285900 [Rhododendron molle]